MASVGLPVSPMTDTMLRNNLAHAMEKLGPAVHPHELRQLLANYILAHFLGVEWLRKHVFGVGGGPSFMRPQDDSCPRVRPEDFNLGRYNMRAQSLADDLLNLHSVEGFHRRLPRLKTEDLETCVAELESARLILSCGIPFRFVNETGKTGSDYDIEMAIDGALVACETKCKLEETELSRDTVRDTLEKARKQLPTDKPGVVVLKMPEIWGTNPSVNEEITSGMEMVFRVTGRISAVVLRWEAWDGSPSQPRVTNFYRVEHNPNGRNPLPRLDALLIPDNATYARSLDAFLFGKTATISPRQLTSGAITLYSTDSAGHPVHVFDCLPSPVVPRDG